MGQDEVVDTGKTMPRQPTSLWRNRNYLLLWSGQMISLTGTGLSQFAFPLLVLALTNSPAQMTLVGALRGLPFLLLSLPAGALVDRWNRKKVMIICDLGRTLLFVSIPLAFAFGRLTVVQLYVVSLLEGILFTFFNLAETASLPNVVEKEQLAAAAAQNEATYNFTFLVSPLLGGILYSLGRVLPFLTDALSYLLSVGSIALIRARFQKERDNAPFKLHIEIREGLLWLWHQPLIRYLSFLTGCINLFLLSSEAVVIILAQRLHASPFVIGVIFTVGGIGSTVGALLSAPIQRRFRFGYSIISTCWLMALLWPLCGVVPNPFLLAAVFAGITLLGPIYNVMQYSYRMALIPDALQGRINSVFRLITFGVQTLGLPLTGVLIQRFGPITTIEIILFLLIVLALITTLNVHVRHARSLAEMTAL